MKVSEIMTHDPACATPDQNLIEVSRIMKDCDCGALPVVEDLASKKPLGIVTDRDIVIRGLAEEKDPFNTAIESCMTRSLVTVSPEDKVEECISKMERHQVKRILVVDANGSVAGIVVQAHIARNVGKKETGELVQDISESR